jgi:hypothetical protein
MELGIRTGKLDVSNLIRVSHLGAGPVANARQRPRSLLSRVVVETGAGAMGGVLLEQFGPEQGIAGAMGAPDSWIPVCRLCRCDAFIEAR